MTTKNEHGLTPPRERFAVLVAGGMALIDAFREAYPKDRGSRNSQQVKACELRKDPRVAARIEGIQGDAVERATLKLDDMLEETRRIMLASVLDLIEPATGRRKRLRDLDAATAAALEWVETDKQGRITSFRFHSKNAALERAAKILGAFEKDNRQKTDPLQSLLKRLQGNVVKPNPDAAKPVDPDDPDD